MKQREIKCRVYDQYRDKLIIDLDDVMCYHIEWGKGYLRAVEHTPHGEPARELKLDWYTGLKDKEGNEIYEGDVLICNYGKHFNEKNGLTKIGSVIYDFKSASYRFSVNNSKVTVLFFDCHTYEIIGNVHQHKHLLNETT